jgi:hypothetical protein
MLNRDMEPKVNSLRQFGLAAGLLPLFFAFPCSAQETVNNSSGQLTNRLGPSYVPSSPSLVGPADSSGGLFPSHLSGVSVSQQPTIEQDGSTTVRNRLVGSVPIADNINLGIGLFSVDGARVKEREFRRSVPMSDVFGRDKTVAAVGLSVRF